MSACRRALAAQIQRPGDEPTRASRSTRLQQLLLGLAHFGKEEMAAQQLRCSGSSGQALSARDSFFGDAAHRNDVGWPRPGRVLPEAAARLPAAQ
jgi:hypothetical protein